MSNPNAKRLGIGIALKQPIGYSYDRFINLKISSFDVDRYDFALVTSFDLLPNARLIKFLPASGYLFFAVTSLADCHRHDLNFKINPSILPRTTKMAITLNIF
jgi:hypothetical protein